MTTKEQKEQEQASAICCGIALAIMAIIADKEGRDTLISDIKSGMKVVKNK